MAYGNNLSGKQPRAHFMLAGGSTIKFRHPYLAGQISNNTNIDEIDISACVKLDGRFFEATPNQESARQEVMIDGSTVTICNRLLNGTITMPIVRTTGVVATGDFISALQLIKTVGDCVGGLLTKTDYRNGKVITRLYYGVTVASVPDDVSEGMAVPTYDVRLLYAGWLESVSDSVADNMTAIWSAGLKSGVKAYFAPYTVQNSEGNYAHAEDEASACAPNLDFEQKAGTIEGNPTKASEVGEDSKGYLYDATSNKTGIIQFKS
jgi:hypothetical protein